MHALTLVLIATELILGWRWYASRDREVKAANNAVAAKLTFNRLNASAQAEVAGRALAICHQLRGEAPDFEKFSEPQQLPPRSRTLDMLAKAVSNSESVGYRSVSAFRRVFTDRMGMTPGQWRRQARGVE